jgi:hypothetical protein
MLGFSRVNQSFKSRGESATMAPLLSSIKELFAKGGRQSRKAPRTMVVNKDACKPRKKGRRAFSFEQE